MLLAKPSFLLKYAVRNALGVLNPKINQKQDVVLPKQSVIHYVDANSNVRFPTKDLYYFKDTPAGKKIRLQTIADLAVKEGNPVLRDKTLASAIRVWYRDNLRFFRNTNLSESPVPDDTVVSLINYNAIKEAYRYTNNPFSDWYRYSNFYTTYLKVVKETITSQPSATNFLPLYVPTVLYSYNVIKRLSEYNHAKLTRLVKDQEFLNVIQLFLWLDHKTRDQSVYNNITDEDSAKIVLAVEYKDHVTYLPLSLLSAMSDQSKLEGKFKKSADKVQKLFVLFMFIVQNKTDKLLEQDDVTETDVPLAQGLTPYKREISDSLVEETEGDIDIDQLEQEYVDNANEVEFAQVEATDVEPLSTDEELTFTATDEEIQSLISEKDLDDKNTDYLSNLMDIKAINTSELRGVRKLIEVRKTLKSPYDPSVIFDDDKVSLSSDKVITTADKDINIHNPLVPTNMQQNILRTMDSKYLSTMLRKDVLSCVANIEKAGVVIRSYEIEEQKTKLGNYEIHRLVLKPLLGKESTVYFKLPKVNEDGTFIASSIKVRLRKSKQDLPIRKISDSIVALTSNYSKLFISRTEKKAYDYYSYFTDHVRDAYIKDEEHSVKITKVSLGNHFYNKLNLPNIYAAMSMVFSKVSTESATVSYTFLFNYEEATNYIKPELMEEMTVSGYTFCGFTKNNLPLVVDKTDTFYVYDKEITSIGKMEDILEIPREKIPVTFSNIKVLGKDMPLGVALAYYLGFNNLVKITKANPVILETGKHYTLSRNEYQIKFADYKLIFNRSNKEATLLLAGFLYFKDFVKEYTLQEFNKKNIYLIMIEELDFNMLYLKELDLLKDLFLDPITVDVLNDMHEPTEYLPILLRANQLLTNYQHPDVNDSNYTRIRGYDRIPGLMYRALSESIRNYKFKTNRSNKIELSPYAVWNNIVSDNSKKLTEDINPINDLKELESVTLVGQDGLNKEAISSKIREYTPSDMGVTSESTVDSSDVAINTFLTPYARFKNLRGMIDITDNDYETNPSKLLSTSALLVPGVDHDDPKRVNFVGIQNSHTIAARDYHQPLLRTGYEYMVPHRTSKLYCYAAKQSGTIVDKTAKTITIEYKDLTKVTIPIGRQHGLAEGTCYPHNLTSEYNVGDKFSKDDILTYNTNFFEKDWLDPKRVIMKINALVTTALTLNNEVYEDSSALSHKLAEKLSTRITKVKSFVVEFGKNLINILPVGTAVEPNTVLFTILDETSNLSNLTEDTVQLLSTLAHISPKAKLKGVIDKYEIYYNGSVTDMSPTLKKLAKQLDAEIKVESKHTDLEVENNAVDSEYRVEGNNLQPDTLEIKVYITIDVQASQGDKFVFGAQLKTVVGDIMQYNIHTEDNREVLAMFGFKSISNRMVLSPYIAGTTNTLLKEVSKQVAAEYFS